jgi:hypothetical protein
MAHISSIGAAMFSTLCVCTPLTAISKANFDLLKATPSDFALLFDTEVLKGGTKVGDGTTAATTTTFLNLGDVRSFPAIGNPANIVKVPVYGQAVSSSVQGQSDAPQLEIDLNYVPSTWNETGLFKELLAGDTQYVFRFTLLNSKPSSLNNGAIGVENSSYYWIGKFESLIVTPSLTDSTTAKLTLSLQSEFYGAYTSN